MAEPNPTMPAEFDLEDHWHPLYNPFGKAIIVNESLSLPDNSAKLFLTRPLYAPLLFPNVSSDARDHCANERTLLSWLRLSIYLAVVSVAIILNFHLKHQATSLEKHFSQPLGIIFFILSLACLIMGFANYIKTVAKYSRRQALVESGWKTQAVFGVVALAIIATCALLLASDVRAAQMNIIRPNTATRLLSVVSTHQR